MNVVRLASTLALAAVLSSACMDPPITIVPIPEAGAMTASDAAVEGGFDLGPCKACMATPDTPGPGCGTEYSACESDSKCPQVLVCIYQAGCFGGPSSKFLTCGIPCVTSAGIAAGNDPALGIATNLFECVVNGACGPECVTQ